MSRHTRDEAGDSADDSFPLADEVINLLHCLGFVYMRHGQARRATVLLMLVAQAAPDRVDVLRTLAAALIAAGLGERACAVLDAIQALDPARSGEPMMRLMRARALLLQGRRDEARVVFRGMRPQLSDAAD